MRRLIHLLIILVMTPLSGLAGENDLYDFLWLDPDKKVYVLQNKLYQKKNSLYVDLGYISNLTSEFEDINGASLKVGYYFQEEWAIELQHNTYASKTNSTYESVKAVNDAEPFIRKANSLTALFAVWSPFYGKINTFNKIYYFDISFGIGYGQLNGESNLDSVRIASSANYFKGESFNPVLLKSNIKFHINQNFHIGVEFLNTNFQAGSPKTPSRKEWKQFNDLVLSVGVSF